MDVPFKNISAGYLLQRIFGKQAAPPTDYRILNSSREIKEFPQIHWFQTGQLMLLVEGKQIEFLDERIDLNHAHHARVILINGKTVQ